MNNTTTQATDAEQRKECQICERKIKANTGTIAHHGYQRPGMGYQTSSCPGAKELPYEVSCDLIPVVIKNIKAHKVFLQGRLKEMLTTPPETITKYARYGFQKDEVYTRPEDFNVEDAMEKGSWGQGQYYAMEFKSTVKQIKAGIEDCKNEIVRLQARVDNWVYKGDK